MTAPYKPAQVIPNTLAGVVEPIPYWFVIGGQAVRCFAPYRPSRDVDLGVDSAVNLDDLVSQLRARGEVEIQERTRDTVHLLWNGIKVSAFVLAHLMAHVEEKHLDVTGVVATKLHAILDRGLRRDFFDLYVMLEQHRLGIVAALAAIRKVYQAPIDDGLLLRALTYFDDAEREAPLPGEGPRDWNIVKDYFLVQVGSVLVPPIRPLVIQAHIVDVTGLPPGPPDPSQG
ncbi:MAG: nucleotidyl transferase AbiEii/AbiGii toxin family protein [Acidobacteria bacterium]|nr:nucleotidyl transferase AbiEii/AbiGii toxin family protein [Acidobacteriota bacterium]